MKILLNTALVWLLAAGSTNSLERGTEALAAFRVEEAVHHFKQAFNEGPYHHARHVKLFEQLGIAYAYLGRQEEAMQAFDMLLYLSPGHALSYTLSPKVTFLFEKARNQSRKHRPPLIDMNWPRDLQVTDPIPLDVEVVSDPKGFLRRAELHYRRKGQEAYLSTTFDLPAVGGYRRIKLGPVAADADGPETLQVFLTVHDSGDNQVFLLGSADHPREITLAYTDAESWYEQWWVWAILGGMVAAGTGAAVYFTTQQMPDTVGGTFQPTD